MAALAVAMVAAVFLVTAFLFGAPTATVLTAFIGVSIVALWWALPTVFGPDNPSKPPKTS